MKRDRVTIGGVAYRVVRKARIRLNGKAVSGSIDFDNGVMSVQSNKNAALEWETEWHESAHAMDDAFSLGLTHEQITALGKALAQVMPDNQWLGQPRMRE